MEKILETFFKGNLFIESISEKRTPELQEACNLAHNLIDELSAKLEPEEKELLDKVVEALHVENQYYISDRFIRGYSLGSLIMLEIIEKRDEILSQTP